MEKLEYQEKDGKVFCPLANKWLVAKPEEKVRQKYITVATISGSITIYNEPLVAFTADMMSFTPTV